MGFISKADWYDPFEEAREREASRLELEREAKKVAERNIALRTAFKARDSKEVISLLQAGATIDAETVYSCVEKDSKDLDWGELFLKHGKNISHLKILEIAIQKNSHDVVQKILKKGRINKNEIFPYLKKYVKSENIVWLTSLLAHDESLINADYSDGRSPQLPLLFMAIYLKKYKVIEYLIKKGAKLDQPQKSYRNLKEPYAQFDGYLPIHIAAAIGDQTSVELLIKGMGEQKPKLSLELRTSGQFFGVFFRYNAVQIARQRGHHKVAKMIEQAIFGKSTDKTEEKPSLTGKKPSYSMGAAEEKKSAQKAETLFSEAEFKLSLQKFMEIYIKVEQHQQDLRKLTALHAVDPISEMEMKEINKDSTAKEYYDSVRTNLYQMFVAAIAISSGQVKIDTQIMGIVTTKGFATAVTYALSRLGAETLKTIPMANILGSVVQMAGDLWIERGRKIDLFHISKLCQVADCNPWSLAQELARKMTFAQADRLQSSTPLPLKEGVIKWVESLKQNVDEALSGQPQTTTERRAGKLMTEWFAYATAGEFAGCKTRQEVVDRTLALLNITYTPPLITTSSASSPEMQKVEDLKLIGQSLHLGHHTPATVSDTKYDTSIEIAQLKEEIAQLNKSFAQFKERSVLAKQQQHNTESDGLGIEAGTQVQVSPFSTASPQDYIITFAQHNQRLQKVEKLLEQIAESIHFKSEELTQGQSDQFILASKKVHRKLLDEEVKLSSEKLKDSVLATKKPLPSEMSPSDLKIAQAMFSLGSGSKVKEIKASTNTSALIPKLNPKSSLARNDQMDDLISRI